MKNKELNDLEEEKHDLWTAESIPDWVLLLFFVLSCALTLIICLLGW